MSDQAKFERINSDRTMAATPDGVSGRLGTSGRALIVVSHGASRSSEARGYRMTGSSADFVTQILACDRRLPDYRTARRASPAAARTAYAGRPNPARAALDVLA